MEILEELKKVNTRLDDVQHQVADCGKDKDDETRKKVKDNLSTVSSHW